MRLFPRWLRSASVNNMAATPNPSAESVMEGHDGGPEWEGREKASFESSHGGSVWYRRWSPQSKAVAMLFIAHGLHSHGGRWSKVAHHYTEKGYLVFANDHVGHGLTVEALEGGTPGMVDDHQKMTDDFALFVEKMIEKEEDKTLPVLILGHSLGALVATVAAGACQDHPVVAPRFKKLALSGIPIVPGPGSASPFGFRFLYPISRNAALAGKLSGWLAKMDPGGPACPIDQGSLSADAEVSLQAAVDPLMVKGSVKNKTAFEVFKLIGAAKEGAKKISVPTFLFHGADDDIAYPSGSEEMKSLLMSSNDGGTAAPVELQVYDGVKHEVLKHADKFEAIVGALDKHWGV